MILLKLNYIYGWLKKHQSSTSLVVQWIRICLLPRWLSGKYSSANAGDIRYVGSIPGSGRTPRGGNGIPLQYFGLDNPMDRGTWQVTVHGITES